MKAMQSRLGSVRLRNPDTLAELMLDDRGAVDPDGTVVAPWSRGVLLFKGESYADNFGWQWNAFQRTQFDSSSGDTMTLERMLLTLGLRREDLVDKLILEAGSGAGRFTEQLLACGAIVCTFDASSAVEANQRQNASSRAMFLRASIYEIPFEPGQFDIVLCLGVLQHTPDRARAIRALAKQLAHGGLLCVDSYRFTVRYLLPSYVIGRRLISRLRPQRVRKLARWYVDLWWPARRLFRHRWARALAWVVSPISPVFYYWGVSKNRDDDFLKEWAYLDTHDFLSARHDVPQTRRSFRRLLEGANLVSVVVEDLARARTVDGRIVSGFYAGRGTAV